MHVFTYSCFHFNDTTTTTTTNNNNNLTSNIQKSSIAYDAEKGKIVEERHPEREQISFSGRIGETEKKNCSLM